MTPFEPDDKPFSEKYLEKLTRALKHKSSALFLYAELVVHGEFKGLEGIASTPYGHRVKKAKRELREMAKLHGLK